MDDRGMISPKNSSGEHLEFNFENQPAPVTHPERNDHYWPKMYDIRKHHFEITVKPIETSYWRFGFRYFKTDDLPPITEARHTNKNIVDIHLCIGDMRRNRVWHNQGKAFFQSYHVKDKLNPRLIADKYKGEEITFITKWNPKTTQADYELVSNGRILYQNGFDMSGFNFCMFGGWADFNTYKLSADIKVIRID